MQIGSELVARLRLICGESHVLADPAALAPYRSDAQRRHRALPAVAVLPGSAVEVASVVRACADAGVPFVARGAGTGLAGGGRSDRWRACCSSLAGCDGSSRSTSRTASWSRRPGRALRAIARRARPLALPPKRPSGDAGDDRRHRREPTPAVLAR